LAQEKTLVGIPIVSAMQIRRRTLDRACDIAGHWHPVLR
jgi:hypothetical protein